MAKKNEAPETAAEPQDEATQPLPDVLGLPELANLSRELRRMGPRRAARHELAISSDLMKALREQFPNLKPGESRLMGTQFVVDGNMDGLAYKLTKQEAGAK